MVATQREISSDNDGLCPVCWLPCTEVESRLYGLIPVKFGTCPRCGQVATTRSGTAELRANEALRRKVQWVNLHNFQGRESRFFWTESGYEGDNQQFIPIAKVNDFSFPEKIGEWSSQVILEVASWEQTRGERRLPSDLIPRLWYPRLEDLEWLLKQIEYEGLWQWRNITENDGLGYLNLGFPFWQRVEELAGTRDRVSRKSVFVASWFADEMDAVFHDGIAPAIKATGYDPVWLKVVETIQKIDDRILSEIRNSRFLVVDVTGHRQAVYFEAGFAMGLGIPVVWTCRADDLDKSSFDTRQYSHITWENAEDLQRKLEFRIKALNL